MIVTIFKNRSEQEKTKPHYVELSEILDRIKTGKKLKHKIEQIRGCFDDAEKRRLKNELPCICFSGKFKSRFDKELIEHSGLVILDFDEVDNIVEKKKEFANDKWVYSVFVSPGGAGLKVLVRIPPVIEKHRGYYTMLKRRYLDCDPTSINESRICFDSYDPDIYINTEAEEWTEYTEYKDYQKAPTLGSFMKAEFTDYSKINIALKMIRNCGDGEKHAVLLKASKLMGGYIAGGDVEEVEAERLLEVEISRKKIDSLSAAITTIKKGIEYGKAMPLSDIIQEIKPKSSGIKFADEIWDKMKYGFTHGKKRGETTHFKTLDEHFKWKKGEISLIIGRPGSGKSEFTQQLMLMKAVIDGWKWAVFSPESYPEDEFYDSMIHSYVGKSTDPYFKDNQMTLEEYEKGYNFVRQHFFYIYPDDMHTMDNIESNFTYLVENKNISGTFIDPFNQLTVDSDIRDDKMLSNILTQRKRYAVKYNLCDIISSHPKNMLKTANGEYDVPDIYDIHGGAMWANKMDNIVSVYRPNQIRDPKDTNVEIHVKKVKKQRLVGVPGMITLDYRRATARFYENGDVNALDIMSEHGITTPPTEQLTERFNSGRKTNQAAMPASDNDLPSDMPF